MKHEIEKNKEEKKIIINVNDIFGTGKLGESALKIFEKITDKLPLEKTTGIQGVFVILFLFINIGIGFFYWNNKVNEFTFCAFAFFDLIVVIALFRLAFLKRKKK